MVEADLKNAKIIPEEDIITAAEELQQAAIKKAKSEINRARAATSQGPVPGVTPVNPTAAQNQFPSPEEIEKNLSWIVDRFKEFLKPNPSDFDDTINTIVSVEAELGGSEEHFQAKDLQSFDTAKDLMADWQGVMATKFMKDYLQPAPVIAANQGILATNLRKNLEALKAVYITQRRDALEIAQKGKESIEAIQDCDGEMLQILLSIALGASGVGGIFLGTAKTAVKVVHATINAAGSFGSGYIPTEGKETELGGDDVRQVMENVKKCLNDVEDRVKDEEEKVTKYLKDVDEVVWQLIVDGGKADTPVMSNVPSVLGNSRDEFHEQFFPK